MLYDAWIMLYAGDNNDTDDYDGGANNVLCTTYGLWCTMYDV